MSAIKPPAGPGNTVGPSGITGPEGPTGPAAARGASFKDHVASGVGAAGSTAPAGSAQAVVADLRAGAITPDQAVRKLTDLAVARSGAPPAMRPAVEARMRELLVRDPVVRELLQRMGASLRPDE